MAPSVEVSQFGGISLSVITQYIIIYCVAPILEDPISDRSV